MYRVVCDILGMENVTFEAFHGVPLRSMDLAERKAKELATEGAANVDIQFCGPNGWVLVSHHVEREV